MHRQPRKNQESECHAKVKASVVSSKNKKWKPSEYLMFLLGDNRLNRINVSQQQEPVISTMELTKREVVKSHPSKNLTNNLYFEKTSCWWHHIPKQLQRHLGNNWKLLCEIVLVLRCPRSEVLLSCLLCAGFSLENPRWQNCWCLVIRDQCIYTIKLSFRLYNLQ